MTTIPQSPAIAIPDAMVEPAAKAMYELSSAPIEWDLLPAWLREIRCRHTRAALQAALTPEFLRQIVAEQGEVRVPASDYDLKIMAQKFCGLILERGAFFEGFRAAERHHGITAMRSAGDQPREDK